MIRNACAKRIVTRSTLLLSPKCCFGTTATATDSIHASNAFAGRSRMQPLAATTNTSLLSGGRCSVRGSSRPMQQRYRSVSGPPSSVSSKRPWKPMPKRRKQHHQQQQQQQYELNQNPTFSRSSAIASVMIVPLMFVAWGASDWIFGNHTNGQNEGLRKEFLEEQQKRNHNRKDEIDNNDNTVVAFLDTKPTIFHCVIRKNNGLKHCLPGVQLGDVVEVVEEGVGPEKAYNLCRLPAKLSPKQEQQQPELIPRDTYGWFPTRWLQKLDHYESVVLEQRRILSNNDPK